jgi:hypothetical protein
MDSKGDTFRFLVDKKYNPYFKEFEYLDYNELKNAIDNIYVFFDFITSIPIKELDVNIINNA